MKHIMRYTKNSPEVKVIAEQERALPGNEEFAENGWFRIMLGRYLFAVSLCRDKSVLDTCCGLGWGAYLISSFTKEITGIDICAEAIAFSQQQWNAPNLICRQGDALSMPFDDNSFDVVLAFEALEHFSRADGERYIKEMMRVLKPGGSIVASSSFPPSEKMAQEELKNNPYHLHIYTASEIRKLFKPHFRKVSLLGNLIVTARNLR
jgi:ubiquinone/menaquinone biosynthesis C-methylase UbiE